MIMMRKQIEVYLNNKKIKAKFKYADKLEIPYVIIIGEDEIANNTVKIKNETKTKLTQQMLTPDVKINTKKILIYHTHTCESYTPSEKYTYKKSGNFRTTDKTRSVVRTYKIHEKLRI